MRVLLIGGTGLSGPFIASELIQRNHEVIVYHRGKHQSPFLLPCQHILGDRRDREQFEGTLRGIKVDAIIDMCSLICADSAPVIAAFRGRIQASVHISSGDVYADLGGPLPISEDAPLREELPYGGKFPNYDKKSMERALLGAYKGGDFPATVIRYPAIYGPGRSSGYPEWELIRRVLDKRTAIPLPLNAFDLPLLRGYVANLAAGVVAALENERAVGRVYNLADIETLTLAELAEEIARILGHPWKVVRIPNEVWRGYIYSGPTGLYDLTRARQELGYDQRVGLKAALEKTVLWQVEHPPDDPQPWDVPANQAAYELEDRLLAGDFT